ncbi:hypothetical protein [Mucilaginibacter sp. UYCu711]|uniref:hypothetical protein n=1 Tax=Mucilaginibacter sp. UYCu711 TaxID=3156339 RepID=UPI003D20E6C6
MKMLFAKNDLLFKNRYHWSNEKNGDIRFLGIAFFNRHQGNEVLFLINQLMDKHDHSTLNAAKKMEAMLVSLPNEEQTHQQVSNWIIHNRDNQLQHPKRLK